jgi:phospholipase/carboxylesterase
MHEKNVLIKGKKLGEGSKALIMVHGRGASAEDIVSLSSYLQLDDFTIIAPRAKGNTWYPYSFLEPPEANEPWLSSAISVIKEIVSDITGAGIPMKHIYFLGFSQGACLTLEFVTRQAVGYGGVCAFTGGLIGNKIHSESYKGNFEGTPLFIGTSDPDPHVPVIRVQETANIIRSMNGTLTLKIYPGMGHTINEDEIQTANKVIFGAD